MQTRKHSNRDHGRRSAPPWRLAAALVVVALHAGCSGTDGPAADTTPHHLDAGVDAVDAVVADAAVADATPPAPDAERVEPAKWPETPKADETKIVDLMKQEHAPGLAACLVKSGKLVWCDGFGLADVSRKVPVTRDTPFLLASATAAVTAVAVLKLWEDGAYGLDDDVDKVLPFKVDHPAASTDKITLRQLLSHAAGIDDNWTVMNQLYGYPAKPGEGGVPPMSLADAMKGYFTPTGALYSATNNFLWVGPGKTFQYSNMGVALAGYVAEVAAKQAYADLYAQKIFKPLGMSHTAFRFKDLGGVEVALPYTGDQSTGYATKGHYTFSDAPDGGLRSSARDMARFLAAIMRGGELGGTRILKQSTVDEMLKVQHPALNATYGLSWYSLFLGGKTWIGHRGGVKDGAADMAYCAADKVGVVILRNAKRGSADAQLRAQIAGMVDQFALP